jgi:hypothetical protein
MSRSGYTDECDLEQWENAMWRGRIASATRGKRGQAFFCALVEALDAMPEKRLIAGSLNDADEDTDFPDGDVCALGCLARSRGAKLEPDDTYDYDKLGSTFNIVPALAQEVMWHNDDAGPWKGETPEERWTRVRTWAAAQVRGVAAGDSRLGEEGKP